MQTTPNYPFNHIKRLLPVALAALLYTGCERQVSESNEETPTPAPVQTEPPKSKLIVAAEEAAAAKPQRPDYLAPEGTYFLVGDHSVEENDSITGFRSGTKLIKRGESGNEYMVNGKIITLRDDQVTNDLRTFRSGAISTPPAPAATGTANTPSAATPNAILFEQQKQQRIKAAEAENAAANQRLKNVQRQQNQNPARPHIQDVQSNRGLQTNTTMGSTHTRNKGGWQWHKTTDGKYWTAVKPLGPNPPMRPSDEAVR